MVNSDLFFTILDLILEFRSFSRFWILLPLISFYFLDIILVLEILDFIPLDIILDRLLNLFRYFSLDTVPGPRLKEMFYKVYFVVINWKVE